jgi:hypothetical protein
VRVAGLAVNIPTRGRPVLRLVLLDNGSGVPVVVTAEEIPTADAEIPEQLFQVARSVESRLRGLGAERVIVRRADVPTRASKKEGPRLRLLIEGAAVSAARSAVVDMRLGMGKDVAHWHGSPKAALDADSKQMLKAANEHAKYVEAMSAARAGLALP